MTYYDRQTYVTLVIPQKFLDILKTHVETGKQGANTSGLRLLISAGCMEFPISSK